jgi:glutamine phosphoribosylpyrophosphate amidotransferase
MCNIAGYVGNRQAAPILLDMIRRQQDYDGGVSTGIVTYHEGHLYIKKIIGDVDELIKHTDALSLPGTIGIAHTRPGGTSKTYGHAQPFVTVEGNMAACTNGTGRGSVSKDVYMSMVNFLEDNGYIERKNSESDKREQLVFPTEKMLDILSEVTDITMEWNKMIAEDISEKELEIFHNVLDKMHAKSRLAVFGEESEL